MSVTANRYRPPKTYSQFMTARRMAPVIAGTALAVAGITRRSRAGLAMAAAGGIVAYLGLRADRLPRILEAKASVLLNSSPEEAYRLYRKFEDLPLFMYHLRSVTQIGEKQYRWVAIGPAELPIQWDAEVVDERESEFISWQSMANSDVEMKGSVSFAVATGGRGTWLTANTEFTTPAGALGRALAKLFGKDPSFLMQQDLRRLKAFMETGEIPTTEGQSHGPRSAMAGVLGAVDPDRRPQRHDVKSSAVFSENRRMA
jgi:uncharacterized membrane protein